MRCGGYDSLKTVLSLVAAAALGPGWSGPQEQGSGFGGPNQLDGCDAFADLKRDLVDVAPEPGLLAAYRHEDPDTVLNQIQMAVGVDDIATAEKHLSVIRTMPSVCPTGQVLGQFPVRVSEGPKRGLGDEEFTLRLSVDDGGSSPLELDTGYVRVGGLIVKVYGTAEQVERYLPIAVEQARKTLAGRVPGV
ncbi:hypothetical protein HNP84_004312 [Thermocatellispora tengchongensis]|uniref:Uncharacterized protein n=1 Tax=Thermocatellispora tengchongensis TaxID=1073253 RepID=A0A840PB03_9ACTN|nr:hypothetical protein [Thermocatellispora tengchongensis]MBB5134580.1 hypothetical protein [Thermocatellispora tengchongensis]